jgi:hypothetical protein
MKVFFYNTVIYFVFLAMFASFACHHDKIRQNPTDTKDDTMHIKHIKLDGKLCGVNDEVEVFESEANLEIEFENVYQDLNVKIGNDTISIPNKVLIYKINGITEFKKTIEIEITAKDRKTQKINIGVKKALPTEIKIDRIILGTSICHHNSTVEISTSKAMLTIEVLEKYTNLSVKVNGKATHVSGKLASLLIEDITETPKPITILLNASGKASKTVLFNVSKKEPTPNDIVITRVTIDNKPCIKDALIDCTTSNPTLTIEFLESYQGLNVKVNDDNATISLNKVTYSFSGITEDKIIVSIVVNATNKIEKQFNFQLKLKALETMSMKKVLLENKLCKKNGVVDIDSNTATLKIEFEEVYSELKVFVNEQLAELNDKVASFQISGITDEGILVDIKASAKGYLEYRFKFTAKKEKPKGNDNANLKALTLVSGEHTFDFDKVFTSSVLEYESYVASKFSELDLKGEKEDVAASLSTVSKKEIDGNIVLSIVVTAPNGIAKKEYKVVAKKVPALVSEKRELVKIDITKTGIKFPIDKGWAELIKSYSIGKYALSYALWKEVYDWAAQHGYKFKKSGRAGRDGSDSNAIYPNGSPIPPLDEANKFQPVVEISFHDAIIWLNAYSIMEGYNAIYYYQTSDGENKILKDATLKIEGGELFECDKAIAREDVVGFRLPKEKEWRLAASYQGSVDKGNSISNIQKDGTKLFFTKGDSASGAASNSKEDTRKVAWFAEDANYTTHPIGEKQANALGIFDLCGNADEWLFDGDGEKKRYLLGGHVEKEDVSDLSVGQEAEKGTDAGAADWYMSLRVVRNEK